MSSIYGRVDSRDFTKLERTTDPFIRSGKNDITDYVLQISDEE